MPGTTWDIAKEWYIKSMHSLLHEAYSFVEEWGKTKEKALHGRVAGCLDSGVWCLGHKALDMGSMALSKLHFLYPAPLIQSRGMIGLF